VNRDTPLDELITLLHDAGVPHMIVGSIASTFHGPPRSTVDIDIVVELSESTLDRFLGLIDRDRFYVDDAFARSAQAATDQFNVVDLQTGWKVDLIARKDRPFSRTEFARRIHGVIGGVTLDVATPEDTVLSKLEWSARSGSERQLDDAVGVLALNPDLDDAYLDHWARELGVEELLARARELAAA
jgi:hypothetical protein